jgi:lysophospholipid acyltransferase (LPLAT)-like uncharacterized protein
VTEVQEQTESANQEQRKPSQVVAAPASGTDGRKSRSGRTMTLWRLLGYRLAVALTVLLLEILWRTGRLRFIGEERLQALIDEHGAVVPVCWHQHLLLCARYMVTRRIKGLRAGFLISPSLDGEAPSMLARVYGGEVIRGSGTYTGSQAVRALYKQVKGDKLSPLITPDGPRGPRFAFKGGALTVAQLCGVPVVPLAYAASPAKVLGTWDKFVLPLPFSRIVIAVGEAYMPPRRASPDEAEAMQRHMAARLHETFREARAHLHN